MKLHEIYVWRYCLVIGLSLFSKISVSCSDVKTTTKEDFEKIAYEYARIFAHVLHCAYERHYDTRFVESAMNKAIDTFLNNLDPHSNFLDQKTYKSMLESTNGEFFGVGIVIDNTRKPRDKFVTIIDTVPEGPSDKAGIKSLDKIIEIDGKAVEGMTTDQVTMLLKGERHTTVSLTIAREDRPDFMIFKVSRDVVKEQNSLSFFIKDHNIAYLSLNMFSQNAVHQVEGLLRRAQKNNHKALILDLRNNSGGLLNAAIDIAGMFLPKGSLVVTTKDRTGAITASYKTHRTPITKNMHVPLFILINNYTASAAEILAGCLQIHAHERNGAPVFIVGTKTFGKGSVQEVIPIEGCAMKITTSLYYLPNDTTVQGIGIEPDFIIERTLPPTEQMKWSLLHAREHQLHNAIRIHNAQAQSENNSKKNDGMRWIDRAMKMLETDNQLREAINLAGLFSVLKERFPKECKNRKDAIPLLNQCRLGAYCGKLEEITAEC